MTNLDMMYNGVNNSPKTTITESITISSVIIPVNDISCFPEAPNLATIGTGNDAEVIRYNGIEGNTLTGCERGFCGTQAKNWSADTVIYRAYTKYDQDTFKINIEKIFVGTQNIKTHADSHGADGSDPITIRHTQISDLNDRVEPKGHIHDGVNSAKIRYGDLIETPSQMSPTTHAASHKAGGSDEITIKYSQIEDPPDSSTPATHAASHKAGGSDPVSIKYSQIEDAPTSFTASPHALSHQTGGSDVLSLTRSQISDFPTTMPPSAHKTSHQKDGSDELVLDYSQIQNAPTSMTPTPHAVSHGFGQADSITISKSQISDFPTSIQAEAYAASHSTGGSDPISPSSIGAMPISPSVIEASQGNLTVVGNLNVSGNLYKQGELMGAIRLGFTLPGGSAWNANTKTQTINVATVGTSTAVNLIFNPNMAVPNSYETWCNCGVRCISRNGTELTFKCETIPTTNIGVIVLAFY